MFKKISIITFLSTVSILFIIVLFNYFTKKTINQPPLLQNPTPTTFIPINTTPSIEDQLKIQTQSDKKFSDWQKDIYKNYPWYNSLPLQTDNYFVYFDLDEKKFIAYLYPKTSSKASLEEQVISFKNEIITQLGVLGADSSKYIFQWIIQSEP
ncbi:MAG: hypothetical protein HYV39_02130 [Candidatus Levybacteria bacterium]|nr:hypothetical protein [Candidatus Levybacteria bacterium]